MKTANLKEMKLGWFIGNFSPSIATSNDFEVCLKRYKAGETEPRHYQKFATEITLVVEGSVRMNELTLHPDDILLLEPNEAYDFEAITNCVVVAVKFPSLPNDKVLS